MNSLPPTSDLAVPVAQLAERVRAEARKALVAQERAFDLMLVALLVRGHVLLEGVPGTAKTLMAKVLAHLVQADFARVQFTPDLMPSDILGTYVFNLQQGQFHLRKGPIFTSILLGDEINRAPAKTQSALLEAMEERQVTIEGRRMELPPLFMVLATQNPIEYEGTYPLPEAQLDRFLFKVPIGYTPIEAEQEILRRVHHGFDAHNLASVGLQPVLTPDNVREMQALIQRVTVDEGLLAYITQIANATRNNRELLLGASPRASIALLRSAKGLAAIQGRDFVVPDDVKWLAPYVLRHRVLLRPEAEIEGMSADAVIEQVLASVPVPR